MGGRMRVCLLHLGRTAAGPLLTLQLARALRDEGHYVGVVYSANAEIAGELSASGDSSLPVETFTGPVSAAFGLVRLPAVRRRIARYLDEFSFDVVIVTMEQVWQPFVSSVLASGARRVILAVHDATNHPGEDSWISRSLRRAERRHADAALTFSRHVADSLIETQQFRAEQVISTVHPAFATDARYAARDLPEREVPVVGFFGRMSKYKGLQLAVDAVEEVRRRGRRIRLKVAGANVPHDIEGIEHEDNLIDSRWIPQDEVEATLDAFDIALLSYTEASQSGVLGYAMALGLPSVVTPVGGLVEQAQESGAALVASEVSASALADCIEELLSNPELYRSVSSVALTSTKERYSWERVARDTVTGATKILEQTK